MMGGLLNLQTPLWSCSVAECPALQGLWQHPIRLHGKVQALKWSLSMVLHQCVRWICTQDVRLITCGV